MLSEEGCWKGKGVMGILGEEGDLICVSGILIFWDGCFLVLFVFFLMLIVKVCCWGVLKLFMVGGSVWW